MDQITAEPTETVIGHPRSERAAPSVLIEQRNSPEQKHFKNMCGSELLLRRLRRFHFDQAPEAYKRRCLPVVMKDVFREEYLKAIAKIAEQYDFVDRGGH